MNILVIDRKAEGQTLLARMIETFDPTDRDSLDIMVSLASEQNFQNRLKNTDVLIFGSGIEDDARELARQAKAVAPDVEIIMYVSEQSYSSGAFRAAHVARVRKVIPDTASPLDLLQELVSIHEQFRLAGKAKQGRLVAVVHAKGGVGATTLAAGLADVCSEAKRQTLLWDLDIESKDLCRALRAVGSQGQIVSSWVSGTRELTRESLREALVPVFPHVSVLMPPQDVAAAMDLAGHPDGISMVHRLIELARVMNDNIIVDTAGRLGPASGTILRAADAIVVVLDDSLLGLSAVHSFLGVLMPLVKNNTTAIRMVCSGSKLPVTEIAQMVGQEFQFENIAWALPALPFDGFAARWAGTGRTIFRSGQKTTRKAIVDIARGLDLISDDSSLLRSEVETKSFGVSSWLGRIFGQEQALTQPTLRDLEGTSS